MLALETQEIGSHFGDKRLWNRFLFVKKAIKENLNSLIVTCFKSVAERAGAYRFFSNAKVTPEKILSTNQSTIKSQIEKCTDDILMIQDSSTLSYPTHPCTANLGKIGNNKTPGYGIITHNSLCLNAATNVCLGLAGQTYFYHNNSQKCSNRAIEQKESYRWIEHLRNNHNLCVRAIHIADRECDIYEFFLEALELGAKVIVRQCQDRSLGETMYGKKNGRISDEIKKAEVVGEYHALIKEEIVNLSVQYAKVRIAPPERSPSQKGNRDYQSLNLVAIQVNGEMEDGQKILWNLLTNIEINNFNDALKVVNYYTKRWHIELFHKALKTGFKLEEARLEDGIRLQNLIALISIEAALVYSMMYSARQEIVPSPEAFFDTSDLKIITKLMQVKSPPSLQEIIQFIGIEGGYVKTKKYPHPGVLTFFRGWNIVRYQVQAIKRCVE
jgi:hypothetical protein